MNISESNRHAIAIAEAWLRTQGNGALQSINGVSLELKSVGDVRHGSSINPHYRDDFRIIEVVISRFGDPTNVFEITLMKHHQSGAWQTAMIEHHVVGWVSGSYSLWARLTNEGWQVRELVRFASAESCGHFVFDYEWCAARTPRAERADSEPSSSR